MIHFNRSIFFLLLATVLLLARCANPVMPLGGEKDTTPPIVTESVPENYAVNFTGKTITISFNEFVKLDKINQQALISPPLNENPEYRIKGKSVQVIFPEKLRENTTYTLFFGNAIVDLAENNPLESFSFIFSTGPVLDSMSMAGNLQFAFDNKLAENAFVLLYRDEHDTIPLDSLPHLIKPYYVARADKKGDFRFRNLRNEPYHIFALEDKNSNFLYDKGGEAIAFADSMIFPLYVGKPTKQLSVSDSLMQADLLESIIDSTQIDSLQQAMAMADSLLPLTGKQADSVFSAKHKPVNLRLFYEVDSTQRLLRAEVTKPGLLRFAFRYDARAVQVEPMEALPDSLHLLRQYSKNADTLWWYFRPGVLDTIRLTVVYDTLIHDTLQLAMQPRQAATQQRGRKESSTETGLNFTTAVQGRRLDIGKPLIFHFSEPVIHYQMRDSSRFIAGEDTLYNSLAFVKHDSIGLQYRLDWPSFEPEKSYGLLFPDSVFFGLNGNINDTTALNFRIPGLSDYGNLIVDLSIPEGESLILQLLTTQEAILEERLIEKSGRQSWELIKPGKYKLKAIHDRNGNSRWDTGKLSQKLQPEKVSYFSKEIEIRANWDLEESWEIQ